MGKEYEGSVHSQESYTEDLARRARQEIGQIIENLPTTDRRVDKKTPKGERARENLRYLNSLNVESLQEYLKQTNRALTLAPTLNAEVLEPAFMFVDFPGILLVEHKLPFSRISYDEKGVVLSFFSGVGYRERVKLSHGDLDLYFQTGDAGILGLNKFSNMSKESLLKKIQKGIK